MCHEDITVVIEIQPAPVELKGNFTGKVATIVSQGPKLDCIFL